MYCTYVAMDFVMFVSHTMLSCASSVSGRPAAFFMYNVQLLEVFRKAFKYSLPDFKM